MEEPITGIAKAILDNISRVLIGQEKTAELMLTCLLANGHILLEDLPGTGKTTLAKALAQSIDGSFQRIQFTPDLLPSDITGMRVFQPDTHSFRFIPGPVFTNILLADEINRATPRTQSALLECMQEAQVTDGGTTMPLDAPFLVIATQNPIETQGTFLLPEAQLDRFMMKLCMSTPEVSQLAQIMARLQHQHPLDTLSPVVSREELLTACASVREIHLTDDLFHYMASLSVAASNSERVRTGPSPRATIALMRAAQAYAYMHGRDYVVPDDIKAVFIPVLSHRILIRGNTSTQAITGFLNDCLASVPVPTEDRA